MLSARGSFKPQETTLNDIQVEHVLYDGKKAMAMGAGVAASMTGLFGEKKNLLVRILLIIKEGMVEIKEDRIEDF